MILKNNLILMAALLNSVHSLEFNYAFVIDFMNEMKLSCGVAFYCEKSFDIKKWNEFNEFKFMSYYDMSVKSVNESIVDEIMRINYRNLGVILDANCDQVSTLFEISSSRNYFNSSYNWLMLSADYNETTELLSHQNINFDAEITLAILDDKNITLLDIYNPSFKYNAGLVISHKGTYNVSGGLTIELKGVKLNRRSNLHGITLNAGVVAIGLHHDQTLEEYLMSYDNPTIDAQHRHQYRLHKILAEIHNYSMFLHRAPTWGFVRNGTYDGVLRMFLAKQIDFSITPFRHTIDRSYFIDHTLTTFVTAPEILFRHPKNSLRNPFLLPLSPLVWYLILIIMFTVSIFVTLTMKCDNVKNVTFVRAFMTSIGVMCQQGLMEDFLKSSTRTFLIIFIAFSAIIYQFYSSFIVSSLLISPPKTINNLRQLIASNLEVGIEEIVYNREFFDSTTDPIAHELFEKRVMRGSKTGNFYSVDCGIEKMRKGGFAFHVDTAYAYSVISQTFKEEEICDIHQVMLFPVRPLSAVFEKKSPFREIFTVGFLRFKETGILQYHDSKWQKKKPKCVMSVTKIHAIEIEESSWIFMVLSGAILMSFVVAAAENIHFRMIKRRKLGKISLMIYLMRKLKMKASQN
ncbi:ionotropic receptor 75a-like [Chironomus tepperi]|uniref:ionotropic receptor 75a-like n=1 Tax=Chironomus tepperi TaxID=113505 RepID=UPI00391F9229